MTLAQSPHVPKEGSKPGPGDLGWLLAYGLRGLGELIRARLIFAGLEARAIPARNSRSREQAAPHRALAPGALARIAYVLPRISARLPWRSDCLVQAIAGQNWLSALGVASEIRIGVEHPADGPFGAHAWLVHGDEVVTGGDISRYHLLLGESGAASEGDRTGSSTESAADDAAG